LTLLAMVAFVGAYTNAVRVFGALFAVVAVRLSGAGVAVGVRGLACGNRESTNSVAPLLAARDRRRGNGRLLHREGSRRH
jgi:hypothetical protein